MSVHVESELGHGCCYELHMTIIISYFTHHTNPCSLLKGEHGVEADEQSNFSLVFLKCSPLPPTPILDQWLPQENVKVTEHLYTVEAGSRNPFAMNEFSVASVSSSLMSITCWDANRLFSPTLPLTLYTGF